MKTMRFFLLAVLLLAPLGASSQRLINKELVSKEDEKNGGMYQYVEHTYVQGVDTLKAAFDLNGKRITPNGYCTKKKPSAGGIYYTGGEVFKVDMKKKDKYGHRLCYGCNTKGEIVFPQSLCELMGCTYIFYLGEGFFELKTYVDEKNESWSLYDSKGKCIVMNMSHILLSNEEGVKYFKCYKGEISQSECSIYDLSGKCLISKMKIAYIKNEYGLKFFTCKTMNGESEIYEINGKCLISKMKHIFLKNEVGLKYFSCETMSGEKEIYDISGACMISKMKSVYLTNDGDMNYFNCKTKDGKNEIVDLDWKSVFSKNYGYTFCSFYEDYGVWWCENETTGLKHTYSKDLKYYAEGYYSNSDMSKFNSSKKSNPYYEGPYNFTRHNSNTNTYNNTNTYTPSQNNQTNQTNQNNQQQTTPKRDPVPVQVWKPCNICGNSGQCQVCYGAGRTPLMTGGYMECTACHYSGKCTFCAGQGGHYEVEYR
ncbi:MAG: hypothetical protein K5864_03750 [Bacteroidales bacterium]|nr:hypothetical protein [Bacteroidales bacterium]